MTLSYDDDEETALAIMLARERVAEIRDMFEGMKRTLKALMDSHEPPDKAMSKLMLQKISELQTAHLAVVRAEEAFHDKFGDGDGDQDHGIDIEVARRDIASGLDRIRAAVGAKDLS